MGTDSTPVGTISEYRNYGDTTADVILIDDNNTSQSTTAMCLVFENLKLNEEEKFIFEQNKVIHPKPKNHRARNRVTQKNVILLARTNC